MTENLYSFDVYTFQQIQTSFFSSRFVSLLCIQRCFWESTLSVLWAPLMELNFNSAVREQFGCVVLLDLITSLSVARLPAHQRFLLCAPEIKWIFFFFFFVGYELDFSIAFFHAQTRDSLSFYSVQLSAPDSGSIPSKLTFQLRRTRLRLSSPHGLNGELWLQANASFRRTGMYEICVLGKSNGQRHCSLFSHH